MGRAESGRGGCARIWWSRSHSEGLVPPLLWWEGREAVGSGWSLPGSGEKLASEGEDWGLGRGPADPTEISAGQLPPDRLGAPRSGVQCPAHHLQSSPSRPRTQSGANEGRAGSGIGTSLVGSRPTPAPSCPPKPPRRPHHGAHAGAAGPAPRAVRHSPCRTTRWPSCSPPWCSCTRVIPTPAGRPHTRQRGPGGRTTSWPVPRACRTPSRTPAPRTTEPTHTSGR